MSPALAGKFFFFFFTTNATWEAQIQYECYIYICQCGTEIQDLLFGNLCNFFFQNIYIYIYILIFIYLAVLGLSCGMWYLSSLNRNQTWAPCFGNMSLSHWTTREVPSEYFQSAVGWFQSADVDSEGQL